MATQRARTPIILFRDHDHNRLYVVSPIHIEESFILVDAFVSFRVDDNAMPAFRLGHAITCSSKIQNLSILVSKECRDLGKENEPQ
jgi:hypothetical protein